MIISRIDGGLGNQLFQYAAGRHLAYKLNVDFKLDITVFDLPFEHPYNLDKFNISATVATPEEIRSIKEISIDTQILGTNRRPFSLKDLLSFPDNTYIYNGSWGFESFFKDISDILRKELTPKEPLSPNAESYKQKILSAECSVSMHFRHGDFVYNPDIRKKRSYGRIPPLERYSDCINFLKPDHKNLTVFVFSNNLKFIKKNLKLDVPTVFIENCKNDVEEFYLMSLCKHNIIPNSTFSWWAAWLNPNPTKKVFMLNPTDAKTVENWHYTLPPQNGLLSQRIISVPFDRENDLQNIEMPPYFSLLLLVDNDAATIADTLDSLLSQDYKYYEIIIIDNASTDGSRSICRQKIEGKKNVTFKLLRSKVSNAKAWNMALNLAQGYYVSFLKGNARLFNSTLTLLYLKNYLRCVDVICSFAWAIEINSGNKKYNGIRDSHFSNAKPLILSTDGQEAAKMLFDKQLNSLLVTKFYNRKFLLENNLKFDKYLDDNTTEFFFQINAFFHSKYLLYIGDALYIAPKNN